MPRAKVSRLTCFLIYSCTIDALYVFYQQYRSFRTAQDVMSRARSRVLLPSQWNALGPEHDFFVRLANQVLALYPGVPFISKDEFTKGRRHRQKTLDSVFEDPRMKVGRLKVRILHHS